MKYYEIFLTTKPPGLQDVEGGGWRLKHAEAVAKIVYKGKTYWHVLLTEKQWEKWKHVATLSVEQATKEKVLTLREVARKAKRVPNIANTESWKKLPHVFGPGRKPDLTEALDEDVYAAKEAAEKEGVDKSLEITDTTKTGG